MPKSEAHKPVVVGLGEVLWDVFHDGKRLGGAPANFAYHASRQGCIGVVASAIGNDDLGREIENLLAEKALDVLLPRVDSATGTVNVSLDEDGCASYQFAENSAWDKIPFSSEIHALACRTSAVCFGSLAQRNACSRETILSFLDNVPEKSIRVFDVNLRQNFFSDEILLNSLSRTTVLKINEDEFPYISTLLNAKTQSHTEVFSVLFDLFPNLRFVVLTLGKAGSMIAERGGAVSTVPADSTTTVVDTVGAGDSFTAGFVCALLSGADLKTAHRHATTLANFVCSRAGAMPDVPSEFQISEF